MPVERNYFYYSFILTVNERFQSTPYMICGMGHFCQRPEVHSRPNMWLKSKWGQSENDQTESDQYESDYDQSDQEKNEQNKTAEN